MYKNIILHYSLVFFKWKGLPVAEEAAKAQLIPPCVSNFEEKACTALMWCGKELLMEIRYFCKRPCRPQM